MAKTITIKLPNVSVWFIVSIILAVALAISFFFPFKTTGSFVKTPSISSTEIGQKVINYINNNLVRSGKATLVGVKDLGSVYEIDTTYQGREIPVYATKDGKMLFLGAFNLTETTKTQREKQSQESNAFSGLSEKSKECIDKLKLNESIIDNCIKQEGKALIQKEYDLTQEYKARGSPTIFFNGKNLDPVQIFGDRSTESFKKILCCSFKELPKECSNFTFNCSSIDVPKSDKPEIKVFVMARCPFGIGVLKSLVPLYKEFKGKANFDVHYVIYGSRDNPESMHGTNELNQDTTQLCIKKHYGEDAFWNYIACHYEVSGTTRSGGC